MSQEHMKVQHNKVYSVYIHQCILTSWMKLSRLKKNNKSLGTVNLSGGFILPYVYGWLPYIIITTEKSFYYFFVGYYICVYGISVYTYLLVSL